MAKPRNRRKQRARYIRMSIAIYLVILFTACHLGQFTDSEDLYEILNSTFAHIQRNPLDIFPINRAVLTQAAFFGLIVPLLMYTEYLRNRDLRPSEESGSARWNEDIKGFYKKYTEMSLNWPKAFYKNPLLRSVRNALTKADPVLKKIPIVNFFYRLIQNAAAKRFGAVDKSPGSRNIIFTNEVYLSMNGRKTRRNCNVLCIGGSGSGKSRFLVKPNLLQANCSYVITDPSGELLETMGKCLEDMGYEVRVFNLVQMEHSNCYNPFHYIRDQNGVLIMLNALIKNTTPKGSSTSDPFWEKAETALLKACCFYLVSECNKEDQNYANVMKLLRCASAIEGQENVDSALDILMKDLEEKDSEHIAVQSYKIFKSVGGGKTAQSILISCLTRLQSFDLTAIMNLTNTDNINLGDIGDKPVALFCTTPTADTTFNFLVALLYTQLFETLYYHAETECKGKRLKHHVRFLLDEFANIGTIPDFAQKLSTMRKYEISCTIIIQALSQLKAMYEKDWEVLVGNCDSLLFLGGSDTTTLEYFSKLLGKETIRSVNNSRSYGKQGSHSMSYNKTGRELMTPDELRVMDNNNCVLFIRGEYPFFGTKYSLEKHPNYSLSGDADESKIYDVKKVLKTGHSSEMPRNRSRAQRMREETELADSREAERQHRMNSRPVEKRSYRGKDLGKVRPIAQEFPAMAGDPSTMTQDQLEAYYAQVAQMQYVSGARYGEVDPELYQMRQDELFSSYYSDGTEEDLPVRPYTSTVPRNRSPHPPAQRQAVQEKQDAEAPEKAAFSGKSNSLTPPVAVSSPDFAPAENRNQAKGPQEAIDHELLLEDQPDPGDTPETTQQQNGASSPEESVPEFIVQQEVESDGDPTLSWVPEDEDNPTLTWDIEDFDQGYDEDEYEEPDYGYPGDRYIPAEDPTVDFPESELASPDVGEANRAAGKREPYLSQRMGQAASRSVSVPSNEMREQVLEEDQEREEQ